jgi:uncharacterized protein
LQYVAGIGKALAKKIVAHRDESGGFGSRKQLLDVGGLGPKAFEQAAGFLRIRGASDPLDASAVHPERYDVVGRMATDLGVEVAALVGNKELVDRIDLSRYVDASIGEPTLRDIADELVKPGRDPRAEFSPPRFRDDVTTVDDLKPGMVLEGVVTNVTAFGAFVDVGVHQDGLVHVSRLSDRFIKDPAEVVKVGQKLQVRVIEVDLARKRIALSARKDEPRRDERRDDQQQQRRGGGERRGEPRGDRRGGGGGEPRGDQQPREPRGDRRGGGGGDRRRDDGPRQEQGQGQGQAAQNGGQGQQGQQGQAQQGQQGQQGQEGQRGPRGGGGPRGDRGPRRDDRRGDQRDQRDQPRRDEPKPPGYGISGFVNNPFAKLLNKDEDKS